MVELVEVRGTLSDIVSEVRGYVESLGCEVIGDTLSEGTYRFEDLGNLEMVREISGDLTEYRVSRGLGVALSLFIDFGGVFGSVVMEIVVDRVSCVGLLEEGLVSGRGYVESLGLGVSEVEGHLVKLSGNMGKRVSEEISVKIKI